MDDYFDFDHAKHVLNEYTKTRLNDKNVAPFLAYNRESSVLKVWRASLPDEHDVSRMAYKDAESGDVTEAVLTVQGYVAKKDLPPILTAPRNANAARYLRQAVTLTGLGTTQFQSAIETVRAAHTHLARNYAAGRLTTWNPEKFRGQEVLEISNRYLTSRHRQSVSPVVGFERGVDPKNIIARLAGDQYDHLEENKVVYYKLNDDCTKFEVYDPSIFRTGDFVEANFSVFAFPIDNIKEKCAMRLVLRTLALLDGAQSTRAEIQRKAATAVEPVRDSSRMVPIVRKRTYYDEDESEDVSRNLKRMSTT